MKKNKIDKKENSINVEGLVIEALPNAMFKVKLDNDSIVLCTISGKIRINNIRIILYDKVIVGLCPYQLEKGRILYRG
jgi:translation initiation factor IF-1